MRLMPPNLFSLSYHTSNVQRLGILLVKDADKVVVKSQIKIIISS